MPFWKPCRSLAAGTAPQRRQAAFRPFRQFNPFAASSASAPYVIRGKLRFLPAQPVPQHDLGRIFPQFSLSAVLRESAISLEPSDRPAPLQQEPSAFSDEFSTLSRVCGPIPRRSMPCRPLPWAIMLSTGPGAASGGSSLQDARPPPSAQGGTRPVARPRKRRAGGGAGTKIAPRARSLPTARSRWLPVCLPIIRNMSSSWSRRWRAMPPAPIMPRSRAAAPID